MTTYVHSAECCAVPCTLPSLGAEDPVAGDHLPSTAVHAGLGDLVFLVPL